MTAANDRVPVAGVRVVVTVGTDHHPFDRMIRWVNDWLSVHPEQTPGFFIQSGAATVVPACAASSSVVVEQLDQLLDHADVIVCHGGPASIAAAWARELRPIVVPRRPDLGEHVDDHQVVFSRKVAELGRIRLAQTRAEFDDVMAEAVRDPSRLRGALPVIDTGAAVARFSELVEELLSQPRRRLWPRHQPRPQRQPAHRPVPAPAISPEQLVPAPAVTPENTTSASAASDWSRERPRDPAIPIGVGADRDGQPPGSSRTPRSDTGSPTRKYGPPSTADEEQG